MYKILKPTNFSEIIPFTNQNNKENIIIDTNELETSLKEISSLKETAIQKSNNGTSFVVINSIIDIDEVPEEINVVPTKQEAIDVIEMDEMMRDLE